MFRCKMLENCVKFWAFVVLCEGKHFVFTCVCQYISLQTHMRRSYHIIDFSEDNTIRLTFVWVQTRGN